MTAGLQDDAGVRRPPASGPPTVAPLVQSRWLFRRLTSTCSRPPLRLYLPVAPIHSDVTMGAGKVKGLDEDGYKKHQDKVSCTANALIKQDTPR